MRIVAGKFAGRELTSPLDSRIRPTAELVRAALLDLLGEEIRDARVIDLFAGTGALGLEALSRGALSADFVEISPGGLHALKANIAQLRLLKRTRVFKRDALPFVRSLAPGSYDVAFLDPPYESKMLDRVIDTWKESGFARVLAVEHARSHMIPAGVPQRILGDTAITVYRV